MAEMTGRPGAGGIDRAACAAHVAALGGAVDLVSADPARDGDRRRTMSVIASGALPDRFPALLDEVAARAAAGHGVFVRGADPLRSATLVDDVSADAVDAALRDGLPVLCVAETSAGNHQMWVGLPGADGERVRRGIARLLAARYGGDPMAADPRQLGRLAGVPNTKPGRGGFVCALRLARVPGPVPGWLAAAAADIRAAAAASLGALRRQDADALARRRAAGAAARLP